MFHHKFRIVFLDVVAGLADDFKVANHRDRPNAVDPGSYRLRFSDDLGPESLGQSIGREYVYRDAQQLQQFVPDDPNVEKCRFRR